jgi:hypothetical protein
MFPPRAVYAIACSSLPTISSTCECSSQSPKMTRARSSRTSYSRSATCMHDATPPVHPPLSLNLTRTLSLRHLSLVKCVLGWVSLCSFPHHALTTCSTRQNARGAQFGTTREQCYIVCLSQIPCGRSRSAMLCTRAVGLYGGVPLILLTSTAPDASKFRVFGCTVFAKVPYMLRCKRDEKVFCGALVGYPLDALGYRVDNRVTRRITT